MLTLGLVTDQLKTCSAHATAAPMNPSLPVHSQDWCCGLVPNRGIGY